jgi:hypothetical protein
LTSGKYDGVERKLIRQKLVPVSSQTDYSLKKVAINRIFLVFPFRKEEVEIHFSFSGDQEIGSNHRRMLG